MEQNNKITISQKLAKLPDPDLFMERIAERLAEHKNKSFTCYMITCDIDDFYSVNEYKISRIEHLAELRHNSVKALMEAKRQGGGCFHLITA